MMTALSSWSSHSLKAVVSASNSTNYVAELLCPPMDTCISNESRASNTVESSPGMVYSSDSLPSLVMPSVVAETKPAARKILRISDGVTVSHAVLVQWTASRAVMMMSLAEVETAQREITCLTICGSE